MASRRLKDQAKPPKGRRPELQEALLHLRERRRNRRNRLLKILLLAVLLLVALISRCDCEHQVPAPTPDASPVRKPAVPVSSPSPPKLPRGRLSPRPRPRFRTSALRRRGWLEDLRLQLAARGPRLAACFEGVDRPGAVRWSAAVEPSVGRISDQVLAPVAGSALSREQGQCLREVLRSPPLSLSEASPAAVPERVVMVLEF